MEKIDLAYEQFKLPDKAISLIQHCKKAGDEICSRSDTQYSIPQFEPADGRLSWNLLNSVVKQTLPGNKPVFCEWGSGLGLVTLLASIMELPATGIEIEEELFDMSQELSQQFSIPATFINASIYPKDNLNLAVNYAEVEIFFAYPWPNQIVRMIDLFQKVSSSGAIFICYHGGHNYRVLRH